MSAMNMNNDTFRKEVLEEKRPALIEFMAPWCVYCRRIGPSFDKIAAEREGMAIAKVNIDDEPGLADQYGVEVVPTLIFYKDGEEKGRIVAPDSKAKIDAFIAEHL